jgi:raffinose/stachyose/melibiose transport system substrate-binding protein
MKKRTVLLTAMLMIFSLLLYACGGTEEPDATTSDEGASAVVEDAEMADDADMAEEAEPITLTILQHANPPVVEFMEAFNERFQAAYPNVTVDMSVVGPGDLSTVTQTRLTANDIDIIDILGFPNAAQPYMTDVDAPNWQQLIEAGLLLDLSGQEFLNNYDDATIEAHTYNGGVYNVNLGRVTYSGMFVNEDLLAEVGVGIPTTWGELVAACDAVEAADYNCMTVGGADGWPVFVGSYGLMGAFFPDQAGMVEGLWTGDIKWNEGQGLAFIERLQEYVGMLEPGVTGLSHDATPARYAAGDVAFMPTGNWQGPAVEAAEPPFTWSYIPFPGSDNPDDNKIFFGKYDQGWSIAANSPHQEAALNWLAMFSEPDNYQGFVDASGFIPTQPTATLGGKLGTDVAPYLGNFTIGHEQYWITPKGAGQWANAAQAASWFAPFNEWENADELANAAQADLDAGLQSQ